jgi:hypothetical protein
MSARALCKPQIMQVNGERQSRNILEWSAARRELAGETARSVDEHGIDQSR